jgi:flagellar motor protein MotB
MKYFGWFLLIVAVAAGLVLYRMKYQPLKKDNAKLREKYEYWFGEATKLKKSQTGAVAETTSVTARDTTRSSSGSTQAPIVFLQDDLFSGYETELTAPGKKSLQDLASVWKNGKGRILVVGHTDNMKMGPKLQAKYPTNWELAGLRAIAVVKYLASQGIDPGRLSAVSEGETKPVADNATEAGRKKNRRIEIIAQP